MIKKIYLVVLILSTVLCRSQTDKNYADELKACLTDSDVDILNKATYFFEQKLAAHYGSTNSNKNFITYLTELGTIRFTSSLTADFFLNDQSIKIVNELEGSGTFNKIWTQFVEDEQQEDDIPIAVAPKYKEPEKEKLELYILNPTGDYLSCINKKSDNEAIKEILNLQSKYEDIASSIITNVLRQKVNERDFDNGLNKVIVAIGFYYDTVNLLRKNPR